MTADELRARWVDHLVRDHGVPRDVARAADQRLQRALRNGEDKRRVADEVAEACVAAARRAAVARRLAS